jgi:hypothetical protein
MKSLQLRWVVAAAAAVAMVGCRGWNRRSACEPCEFGGGVVVGGGGFDECTTCGKTSQFAGEAVSFGEGFAGDVVLGGEHESLALEAIPAETPPSPPVEARREVRVEKQPEAPPRPPAIEPLPMPPQAAKPAAINVDLNTSVAVAMAGQDVAIDLTIENSGGQAIESADVTVQFSPGLKPKSVSPDGVARIEGQRVVFAQLRNFAPMSMTYKIVAEAVAGASEGRVTVQIVSPILPMGPLTQEAVVKINP